VPVPVRDRDRFSRMRSIAGMLIVQEGVVLNAAARRFGKRHTVSRYSVKTHLHNVARPAQTVKASLLRAHSSAEGWDLKGRPVNTVCPIDCRAIRSPALPPLTACRP